MGALRVVALLTVLVIAAIGGTLAFTELRADDTPNARDAGQTTLPTLNPYHCDTACQIERDKLQDAYNEGYQEGRADACPTPELGHFFAIGSSAWRAYQDCINGY